MSLSELPKLELHLHLEGAAPPAFIRGLAKEKSVDLSGIFREDGSYAYRDFVHFLSVYEAATSVLKSPEDYARLVPDEALAKWLRHGFQTGYMVSETCPCGICGKGAGRTSKSVVHGGSW